MQSLKCHFRGENKQDKVEKSELTFGLNVIETYASLRCEWLRQYVVVTRLVGMTANEKVELVLCSCV